LRQEDKEGEKKGKTFLGGLTTSSIEKEKRKKKITRGKRGEK
jgi:hypothetical protein